MPKFDKLPAYFEELTLKEETAFTLSDLISQLKQQIPVNFVYLAIKERNYQCSTTGWKEPVCERYGFTYENKWIQLDIPHSLLAKLGLKKGEDLPSSFYLVPHLLKKETETTQGGITLKEGEIILVNPHKITLKDQEIQIDLTSAKIKELEEKVAEQTRQIQEKDIELTGLKSKKQTLETELNKTRQDLANANSQLSSWTNTFSGENASQVQTRINSLNSRITSWQINYNNENNRANNLSSQVSSLQSQIDTLRKKSIDNMPKVFAITQVQGALSKTTLQTFPKGGDVFIDFHFRPSDITLPGSVLWERKYNKYAEGDELAAIDSEITIEKVVLTGLERKTYKMTNKSGSRSSSNVYCNT